MAGIVTRSKRGVALGLGLLLATPVLGVICSMDQRPAGTLLVPYFEVDVGNCGARAVDGEFTVVNLDAVPALAHVTIWSDWAVPVFNFDIYLTGYDIQTVQLGEILCDGNLPVTGSAVSNLGVFSIFGTFPACNATTDPMMGPPVYDNPAVSAQDRAHLQAWLTGVMSPMSGDCAGNAYGDGRARGYVTVDMTTACNVNNPAESAYYTSGYLSLNNQLVGDYARIGSNGAVETRLPAVAMESDASLTGITGGPTFYGGYDYTILGFEYSDARQPLPTSFSAEFDQRFNRETYFTVWREYGPTGPLACGASPAPLQSAISSGNSTVFVDEFSNPVGVPSSSGPGPLFGLATQRVAVSSLNPQAQIGWAHVNLRQLGIAHTSEGMAWMSIEHESPDGSKWARHATVLDGQCPVTTVFMP